ncbi:triose-phosphate isomerase [Thiohalomonas denitrificans]|uniref:Triosephosphate isomerase n=1 Tax=Thiohalomonas denitrificans TaxID=415747 RepID=A0A1G5PIY4_9GAMM|nr:triose-phosphate isomerase [Thiohalomonas denitrificans]SCZ49475.1 triosephosphate isomerase [Thiohalomonas denitrificans]
MRRALIAGNWKMNGSREANRELLDGIKAGIGEVSGSDLAVCPPFVYIPEVAEQLAGTPVKWGAQNVSHESSGAFTGEVAPAMVREFGCVYVIIGHSERRTLYGETDEEVAKKFVAARAAGLTPIVCVGETLEEREQDVTEDVVGRQMDAVIAAEGAAALAGAVIAYEPVWAIGTGRTATPEQAQAVHAFIRQRVAAKDANVAEGLQILYGGSMKPENAAELMAKPDIDGGLIGGASLKADQFLAIAKAAN